MANIADSKLPHLDERQRDIVRRVRSWSSQSMIVACLVIYIVAPQFDWLDARAAVLIITAVAVVTGIVGQFRLRAYRELSEVQLARYEDPKYVTLTFGPMIFLTQLIIDMEDGALTWSSVMVNLIVSSMAAALVYSITRRAHSIRLRDERERRERGETLDDGRGRKVGEAIARWFGIGRREHGPR